MADPKLIEENQPAATKRPNRPEPKKAKGKKPAAKTLHPIKEGEPDPAGLAQSVEKIKGVGPKLAVLLEKLGANTIDDLLHIYPHRYDDYTTMKPINRLEYGEKVSLIGTIWEVRSRKSRNNQVVVSAVISDGTGKITATWYH